MRIKTAPSHLSFAIILLLLSYCTFAPCTTFADKSLHAVIFGGGPDVDSNALQIESHTRFVIGLLPPGTKRMVFFADGSSTNATVSYVDWEHLSDAQKALDVLLPQNTVVPTLTRSPQLGVTSDGPSSHASLHRAVEKISVMLNQKTTPVLFYFAGHGSQSGKTDSSTQYGMWNGEELTVRDLSKELSRLPASAPVLLVMAQCYSGAFADAIFRDGNPKLPLLPQDLAGFFSSAHDHEAAGCGLGTDESEYQDFSSYFFGALSGHDRLGHAIAGADFDGDGHVSYHEAFCYALINDPTVDTPVCTSELFLTHFSSVPSSVIYGTSFDKIRQLATPAQRAALEALCRRLKLSGTAPQLEAYDRLTYSDPVGTDAQIRDAREAQDRLAALKKEGVRLFLSQWPDLRWTDEPKFRKALPAALKKAGENPAFCKDLVEAKNKSDDAEDALEVESAMLFRFTHLCESVVLADRLRKSNNGPLKARFERLWKAEQRSLPLSTAGQGPAQDQ